MSVFTVLAALVGLAALPAVPHTETASVTLRPVETENARSLLGENLSGNRDQVADPSQAGDDRERGAPEAGQLTLSIPRLGLEDVAVPTGDSQVELDREGIMRLKDTGVPSKRGSTP